MQFNMLLTGIDAAIEARTQFFTGFKEGGVLGIYCHTCARAWIAALARIARPHRKSTKAPQFNAVAFFKGVGNFFQHGINNALDVSVKEMRVFRGKLSDKF
jgi:hypothetical protein